MRTRVLSRSFILRQQYHERELERAPVVKIKLPASSLRMTVHRRNEESRDACYPIVGSCGNKNNWRGMDNDSSSWDRNSRATSSSWPGDMEEAATRKVLQLWVAIERNLFNEDESVLEPVSEECNQWRTQLVHLRIIGKSSIPVAPQESNETLRGTSGRSKIVGDQNGEEIIMQDSIYRANDSSNNSSRNARLAQDKEEVLEQIFDFVCSEFCRDDESKDEANTLGGDLDEVLRITPAPTYSGRRVARGRKKRENAESRKSSANEHRGIVESSVEGDEKNRSTSAMSRGMAKNSLENDKDNETKNDDDVPQVARNKLGTVFNEKIVVSPVPFVVSTRESFTTLRTTPISFRAQTFEISTPQGLGRYMNSASKTNSAHRLSGLRIPQSHSAWQTPVCPTVWPKNIRLAPIDPSRLPSSKNRSTNDMSGLPHRNRNSLSPITRPAKLVASANSKDRNVEGLEIQGKQIVGRPTKQNLRKTACSPRNAKNSRTKARVRNDRQ